jgi:hypothetical protein
MAVSEHPNVGRAGHDVSTVWQDTETVTGTTKSKDTVLLLKILGINGDFIRSEGETSKEFQFIAGVVIRR